MKKICICLFVLVFLVACLKKEEGKVLVTINNDKMTLQEFNKELDRIPVNMKMHVATQSGKKNYLDKLIVKKLLLKEAEKEKIDSDKEFQERLTDIRDQLIIESLLKKKITADAKITDEDVKGYYDKNKENFKREREINTRHILLKTEEEAKQVQARLNKGEDFVELAKGYSIDPNAVATGGEIGFHPKGSLVPEYESAAFKLKKVGEKSGIVQTKFGYHIIRLEGVKPPSYVPVDEVKDFIRQKILQEKQSELLEKYIDNLKKSAKITINEELLKEDKAVAPDKTGTPDKPEKMEKQEKPETKGTTPQPKK
ncbi:MAG TPA: peptidyl-prolyl cis-trans isomerase [Syntrophorhabdaceae bacterium]|nr:peptidyl-prolyl cis-trans isomerase [Syntrophorhabdaceae bacterium]HNZ58629.1 peptidyl-prolyl cis-trans isomerase [Syntrophorhabdaceae bacterium]HOB68790.1 peptidyl-prolyl cis-trans isomerase [Syntrophorhabdaceae bacterium]HOF57891.1 peptidyl-prolyl cis-trans isomerase [Syntrophorhabdaceae bacterium]HOG39096.1 peptidyl-prolyl cis-trans isomerase [Syntrophorhabdaceae bacterium]